MITYIKSKILQNPAIPCLPLLIVYLLTILPFLLNYLYGLSYITLIFWLPVYLFYKFKYLPLSHILVLTFSGLIVSYQTCTSSDNHITQLTKQEKTYLSVKGTVSNVHYPNKILQWNVNSPQYIIRIDEILLKNTIFQSQGKVLVKNLKEELTFGDSISLTGRLIPIQQSNENTAFSFASYYRQKNISHTLYADHFEYTAPASGFNSIKKSLYELRDKIISKATKSLESEQQKRIVASIFFGYKGLLKPDEKDTFSKSGTAHLFAVSGLHVGIAASLLLIIIKTLRIPHKHIPYFLLPSLFIYVVMTGAPASAVRAFIMLAVWSIARSRILPSTGLNNLAVSALIILLWNPLDLFSLGFLYTFIITSSLVMSYEKSLNFFKSINEKNLWKGNYNQQIPFIHKATMLLLCSLTASMSSWGLNIFFNQQVIPLAFITNFFSSILAWCSFMLACLSITEIPLLYSLQEQTINSLLWLVKTGSIFWQTATVLSIIVILYYLLLFICLSKNINNRFLYIATAIIFIGMALPAKQNRVSIFLSSASNTPTICIYFEGKRYLINTTNRTAVRDFINQNIDAVYFSKPKASHSWAVNELLEVSNSKLLETKGRHISYLKRKIKSPEKVTLVNAYKINSVKTTYSETSMDYTFTFEDQLPGKDSLKISISQENYGKCTVKVAFKNFSKHLELQHQNSHLEFHYDLPNS